jgi:hypothetical protein
MATKAKIEEKLLGNLSEFQRELVEEYYQLQTSKSHSKNDTTERLISIWKEAQSDPVLCKRLELVDELCTNFSRIVEEDSDHQTYSAEYLVPQLQDKLTYEDGRVPATALGGATWLVECPDKQNLSTITLPSDDPQIMQQFKDERCGRCQTLYSTHSWEPLAISSNHN